MPLLVSESWPFVGPQKCGQPAAPLVNSKLALCWPRGVPPTPTILVHMPRWANHNCLLGCCRGWLQTVYKPPRKRRASSNRGSTRLPEKNKRNWSWSDVNSYSLYHIRSNSSLILRCKTTFHKVVPKCSDTSALVPKCSDISALVPKCPGSEVSVHHSSGCRAEWRGLACRKQSTVLWHGRWQKLDWIMSGQGLWDVWDRWAAAGRVTRDLHAMYRLYTLFDYADDRRSSDSDSDSASDEDDGDVTKKTRVSCA